MNQADRLERLKKRYGKEKTPDSFGAPGPRRARQIGGGSPKNSRETIRRLLGYMEGDAPSCFWPLPALS